MKLAEALLLRADIKQRLIGLRERIGSNCTVQEGDEPNENPQEMIEEFFRILQEQESLTVRVHKTNLSATADDGRSIENMIALRDKLVAEHSLIKHVTTSCTTSSYSYSQREVKWKSVLKVPGLQKQADDLSKKIRDLNIKLQETNWRVDLVD